MKKKFLLLMLFFVATVFAGEKDRGDMVEGYNTSARIDVKGKWDFYVKGSFIYWQGESLGADLGAHVQVIEKDFNTDTNFIHMDFDYHPGFKVGMGTNLNRDDWSLFLEYLRYYAKDSRVKDIASVFEFNNNFIEVSRGRNWPGILGLTSEASYVNQSWKVHLDILDLELSRSYYVGKKFTLKPSVAVKGGWVTQRIFSNRIQKGNVAMLRVYHDFKSSSWLLGPEVGIDMAWLLKKGVRLFWDVKGAIFYQRFRNKIKYKVPEQENVDVEERNESPKDRVKKVSADIEAYLGAGWRSYFFNHKSHLDITLGYELFIFFNQYVKAYLEEESFPFQNHTRDLSFQGLTFSMRFDF